MNGAVLTVGFGLLLVFLFFTALYAGCIKLLAPQITAYQCLLTAAATTTAGAGLIISNYLLLKPAFHALLFIFNYLVSGWLIARTCNVEKSAWLGEAKSKLWLLLWVAVGVLFLMRDFNLNLMSELHPLLQVVC
jgi:hypothetical protein